MMSKKREKIGDQDQGADDSVRSRSGSFHSRESYPKLTFQESKEGFLGSNHIPIGPPFYPTPGLFIKLYLNLMGLCQTKHTDSKPSPPAPKIQQIHLSIRFSLLQTFKPRNLEIMSNYRKDDYHFSSSRKILIKVEDRKVDYRRTEFRFKSDQFALDFQFSD